MNMWTFRWSLTASVVACASILYVCAWNMFPVPDGDAVVFLPAIQSLAVNGRLENKTVDLSYATDPDGLGRYLFYPPAFPLSIGIVMKCLGMGGYPSILVVLATIRVASVAIFACAIDMLAKRFYGKAIPLPAAFVAIAFVVGNGLFLLASNGRPEVVTLLLAGIAIPIALSPFRGKLAMLALLVGVTFCFSIANGVIAFGIYAIYLCFAEDSWVRRIVHVFTAGTLMIVLYLAAYVLGGIDVQAGIAGIGLHSKIQLARTDTSVSLLIGYWQSWFFFFAAAALVVMVALWRRVSQCNDWCLRCQAGGAIAFFTAAILFFGVRAAPAHYNVYAFLPIYQTLTFIGFMEFMSRTYGRSGTAWGSGSLQRYAPVIRGACVGVMLVAACMSCRNTALRLLAFPYYLASGCDYRSMKPVFERVVSEHPGTLFYSGGLLMLDDEMRGSIYHLASDGRCTSLRAMSEGRSQGRSVVFVEERNGFPIPPRMGNVVLDAKDPGPPPSPMRGLRILRARQGYSFVAFEQDAP